MGMYGYRFRPGRRLLPNSNVSLRDGRPAEIVCRRVVSIRSRGASEDPGLRIDPVAPRKGTPRKHTSLRARRRFGGRHVVSYRATRCWLSWTGCVCLCTVDGGEKGPTIRCQIGVVRAIFLLILDMYFFNHAIYFHPLRMCKLKAYQRQHRPRAPQPAVDSGFEVTKLPIIAVSGNAATSIVLATCRVAARQITGPSASTCVADTQVQLVALPNHWRATVRFDVKANGSSSRTFPFGNPGTPGTLPGRVFGAVRNDATTHENFSFPHAVVVISGGDDATDTRCGNDPSSPVLHHRGPFALKSDRAFADSWEERARQNDRCNNRCYNGLHRYGLKRARIVLIFFALGLLAIFLIEWLSGGSKLGFVFSCVIMFALFALYRFELISLQIECIFPSTRSSRWANMPVLSFAVEPAPRRGLSDLAHPTTHWSCDQAGGGSSGPVDV